jgi:tetratricopeptide (TPR) repeat protein
MKALPQFEIHDDGNKKMGTFSRDFSDDSTEDLYMEAEDYFFEFEYKKCKDLLRKIILKDPMYHEAYLLLSSIFTAEDDFSEAEKELKKGLSVWESSIPENFNGEIPWGFIENRPYLTLLHELSGLLDKSEKTDEAITISEKLLALNSNDNQGVRWIIGNLYLKAEKTDLAEKFLKKTVNEYPPNRYSYALLLILRNKRWDAIQQLRLAFTENIYIYEHLSFKAPIVPYDIFENSDMEGIGEAVYYLESMGHFWMQKQEELFFMEQIIKHPTVIIELNNIFNLKHELNNMVYDFPYQDDFSDEESELDLDFTNEAREEIFKEIESIKKRINTASSKKILKDLDSFLNDF